jgi:hypothetical protein
LSLDARIQLSHILVEQKREAAYKECLQALVAVKIVTVLDEEWFGVVS